MPGMWATKVNVEKESNTTEPRKLRSESVEVSVTGPQATNPESLLLLKRMEKREEREKDYSPSEFGRCT
jgi:hypothetical protein